MKKYWRSLDEISPEDREKQPEFSVEGLSEEEVKGKSSRRDFLKMLGFTVSYATLATSCEMPVRKAIPYLNQPEEITPGLASYYASTFFDGKDYCSILVKTREGRPIKIEGNPLSSITRGGTTARVQASVLNLYDTTRLQNPLKNGEQANWEEIDQEITGKLKNISETGKDIVILTSSVISPSTKKLIEEFSLNYPGTSHITYDAVSASAIIEANKKSFGKAVIPNYRFNNAKLIVSFNADFLGNWLSSIEYIKGYSSGRNLIDHNKMSKHIQLESYLSLTGTNADERYNIKPSDEAIILLNLYNEIAAAKGESAYQVAATPVEVKNIAKSLLNNQGSSLVVCGTNNIQSQLIVNGINYLLGNYGSTIDLNTSLNTRQGIDKDFEMLVKKMQNGDIGALMVYNCNPGYDYYNSEAFINAIKNVGLTVSFSDIYDETAVNMQFVCPDNNYLESWNDAEPKSGHYSLAQPTIPKLFNTRQAQDSLLKWMGREPDYYGYIMSVWENEIFPRQNNELSFSSFWNKSLHDGIFDLTFPDGPQPVYIGNNLKADQTVTDKNFEVVLYEKTGIGNGKYANNPWLQELPDPITKATWDNYIAMSPVDADEKGYKQEDLLKLDNGLELPVLLQPGQPRGSISIALGYGRTHAGRVGNYVGKNAFPLVTMNETRQLTGTSTNLTSTGTTYPLALTQSHHTMEGRDIVRETTLEKWLQKPNSGNEMHEYHEERHVSLYPTPEYPNFHWGLAVNLNSCIGCGACAIACQAENNVAVIGKEEVRKRRIMHWIRIDRYYSEDRENPETYHQPVMCQQCDNAPCENVCPVAATPHSNEGLNMMAYNRCIGTRYCMNNCPYRVRRFNWYEYVNNAKFPYNMDNNLGKMVLNPDVVVRSRGVVEKCSFCSQRIQEKKLDAKKEGRKLIDGEIMTACQQACPADAISFGNLNDNESAIYKAFKNPRNYHLLEELHTLPSVGYLTKVRNKEHTEPKA